MCTDMQWHAVMRWLSVTEQFAAWCQSQPDDVLQVADGLGVAAAAHPGLRVILHGTPRQWDDPARPWLAVEKNRCIAMLSAAGVPVEERKYFEGQPPSLLMHFECIAAAMAAVKGSGRQQSEMITSASSQ